MKTWTLTLASIALAGCLMGATASAGGEGSAALNALLVHSLETFTELEEKGMPAEELTKRFYWSDALLTGEGATKAARGYDEVAAMVKAAGTEIGVCHHKQSDRIVHSGSVASLILEYSCQPPGAKPPTKFSAIYVWEKRGKEWKIIREVYVGSPLN
jgi:hypothetical protein